MNMILLVVRPFDGHAIGDVIAGPDAMNAARGAHMHDLIRVASPGAEPKPAKEA
jgi:hypothetical protein